MFFLLILECRIKAFSYERTSAKAREPSKTFSINRTASQRVRLTRVSISQEKPLKNKS